MIWCKADTFCLYVYTKCNISPYSPVHLPIYHLDRNTSLKKKKKEIQACLVPRTRGVSAMLSPLYLLSKSSVEHESMLNITSHFDLMQIKTTTEYNFMLIRMAIKKKTPENERCWRCGVIATLCIASGIIRRCSRSGKQYDDASRN